MKAQWAPGTEAAWRSGVPGPSGLSLALTDIGAAARATHIWSTLGWQEIRLRYRRSTLGPLWLTISMGVLVGAMGPLYGKIFGQDIGAYFTYFAVGFIVWQLVFQTVNEAANVFVAAEPFIKQMRMPLSVHVLRMMWRNLIIFAHNFLIVIAVLAIYSPGPRWQMLLFFPGLALLVLNLVWAAMLVGMVCARFRDMGQIVASVMQLAFFLSPILWKAESLGRHRWAAEVNPFYHLLEIVRAPLLGQLPALQSWLLCLAFAAVGFALAIAVFARYRARIAYWV